MAHVEKNVSVQQHFEQFVRKQRRVELKFVGYFVAKTVLVENANQFSWEELCRTQYILKYLFRSHIDHHTLWKTLKDTLQRVHVSTQCPLPGPCFYEPTEKNWWPSWSLNSLDIFDFSFTTVTSEQNLTKLDQKQIFNVLNQFCWVFFFGPIRNPIFGDFIWNLIIVG